MAVAMKTSPWTAEEEEQCLKIYHKYTTGENKMDISNVKKAELPPGRSVWAVKGRLYKEYDIRCKGAAIATRRLEREGYIVKTSSVPKPKASKTEVTKVIDVPKANSPSQMSFKMPNVGVEITIMFTDK